MDKPSTYVTRVVIEARRPSSGFLREAWNYRELLALLSWRDVSVRYKQTALGIAWALFRPTVTMLVFVVVFAYIVRVPSPDAPYALLVLAGLLPWQLLSGALSASSESLLSNAGMLSKLYFPRVLLPVSAVGAALADFLVGLTLLFALMLWYSVPFTWRLLALPGLVALALCLAIGAGLWLSAAIVRFRDLRYVSALVIQVGTFVSPTAYPSSLVPERWQLAYAINPAVGVIDGFRWALFGAPFLNLPALGLSIAIALLLLAFGLSYFRRAEESLTDLL